MEITKEQKMYAEVVQRAWDDADFKKSLIANPVAAIENLIGREISVPQGQKLVVIDQTDESTIYLNLPRQLSLDSLELTEEQLEQIAGGATPLFLAYVGCVVAGVTIGEAIGKIIN